MYGARHLSSVAKVAALATTPFYQMLVLYQPEHR